jgi:hypothetical protein
MPNLDSMVAATTALATGPNGRRGDPCSIFATAKTSLPLSTRLRHNALDATLSLAGGRISNDW